MTKQTELLNNTSKDPMSMRVLLRDTSSREYYRSSGQWTFDVGAAHDFKNAYLAISAGPETGRDSLEVVLSFEDPSYDLTLPLTKQKDRK